MLSLNERDVVLATFAGIMIADNAMIFLYISLFDDAERHPVFRPHTDPADDALLGQCVYWILHGWHELLVFHINRLT